MNKLFATYLWLEAKFSEGCGDNLLP